MGYMFDSCWSLTELDLSSFNTSNVTVMTRMFAYCWELQKIYVSSSWSTAAVTESVNMFLQDTKLVGATSFNSSSITHTMANYASGYLTKAKELPTLSLSKFQEVYNSESEIYFDYYNGSSYAPNGTNLISGVTATDISENGDGSINAYSDGTSLYILSADIIQFPSDCTSMFNEYTSLTTLEFNNINTSKVTIMSKMFYICSGLTSLDISKFDTSNVTSMRAMFYKCSGLTNVDLSSFNTAKVTDMYAMFSGCSKLTSVDVSKFNTAKVTDMAFMFNNCQALTSLDLSSFDSTNVTKLNTMFQACYVLENLDLSNFDTSNVTDMGFMFNGCSKLTSLDLSNFTTSKVTNMLNMFAECVELVTIYAGDWETSSLTSIAYGGNMFYNCKKLVGGAGTAYSSSYANYTYAKVDGGTSSPGYFTYKEN